MSDESSPDYRWAVLSEPDALVLQPAPVPVVTADGPRDVMRTLLALRGFCTVAQAGELDLQASNGCLLNRTDAEVALLVRIGRTVEASRFVLPGLDEQWWSRAVELGHAAVLAVETAVGEDGTTTRDDLLRDIGAGGVLAALVPVEGVR